MENTIDPLDVSQARLENFFEKENRYGDQFEDGQEQRATAVLRHLVLGAFSILDEKSDSHHHETLAKLIKKNLDAHSIRAFVSLSADLRNEMQEGASVDNKVREKLKALSAQKAHKRHHETNLMRIEVHKWLDENMANFKSMDAAAEGITKQQPIAFRTARHWVGEWKKLRSAGIP